MEQEVTCPYCGELITMLFDTSVGEQNYVEDCEVCCRPIEVRYATRASGIDVHVHRGDD